MQHLSVYMYGSQSCYCCYPLNRKIIQVQRRAFSTSLLGEKRHCTSVKLFLSRKKQNTEVQEKTHKIPPPHSYSFNQSMAKNNVWYYQQVLLQFSVGGKHNTSIGNSANKLMAIFKCRNENDRAIKERSVKHTHTGKNPNTWKITWERS